MRFIPRALTGLSMMLISVGLLSGGVWRIMNAAPDGGRPSGGTTPAPTVELVEIERIEARPTLALQGRIQAAKETRLSFPVPGRLDQLSDRLKTGLRVQSGEIIARLDPRPFERRARTSELNLASAKANKNEFTARLEAAKIELRQAEAQTQLRQAQLTRLQGLLNKQLASATDIEAAELALNGAQQAMSAKRTALINAQAALDRGALEVERLQIALDEARQDLADSELKAPFGGVLTEVSVKPGDQLGAGQSLAVLTDLNSLEVAFSTQNPRVIRFLEADGQKPLPLETEVSLAAGSLVWRQQGTLTRVASDGNLANGGRQLFAELNPDPNTLLRPGDWVDIQVTEPPRADLAWIPASALSDDGFVFTVREGRLNASNVEVMQRNQDRILITAPRAAQVVSEVAPRFTQGLPVQTAQQAAANAPSIEDLIAFVENNNRMPADRKAGLLEQLRSDNPPKAVVERVTQRFQSSR